MNVIVRRHYPVEKLPADLRDELLPGTAEVTVTVEQEEVLRAAQGSAHFSRFFGLQRTHFRSSDEIVAHVRALRDEWDRG